MPSSQAAPKAGPAAKTLLTEALPMEKMYKTANNENAC